MDSTLMHSLLLLTTCVALSMAATAGGGISDVITSETTFTNENGTEVTGITQIDVNCNLLTSVEENEEDSSSSSVINDYKKGLSLVTFNDKPDVCYVRNLSSSEKRQAASCRYGSMKVSSDKEIPKDEKKQFETSVEINIDQLSPALQEQCQGKKIFLIKEAEPSSTNEIRSKRFCTSYIVCGYYYYNCYRKCFFFICSNYCSLGYGCYWKTYC